MEPSLAPVAHQFRDTTRLYARALLGVDHDALLTRPGPRSNPLLWVAGHLVQQRTRLLGALGPARQVPWDDLFGTGSIIGDLKLYPSVGELDAVWRSTTEELLHRLEVMSSSKLASFATVAPHPRRNAARRAGVRGDARSVSRRTDGIPAQVAGSRSDLRGVS